VNLSDEKSEILDGVEYRYSTDWIHSLENEDHWRLYWHQMDFIKNELNQNDSILEIGMGSGFLSNYLKSKEFNVTTLDIDAGKHPNIATNIVSYDFYTQYDHIIAFEVFEHIPFDKFVLILPKLKKACRKNIFISLPRNYKILFRTEIIFPLIKKVAFSVKCKRNKIIAGHHFWELDYREYTMRKLEEVIDSAGLKIIRKKKMDLLIFIQIKE